MKLAALLCSTLLAPLAGYAAQPTEISRSFEVRYLTSDPRANGETDFKGDTSIFDTTQRVEFLSRYERAAGRFFGTPDWNQRVVEDAEVARTTSLIKPQPLPEVRTSLPLTNWRYLGSRPGQSKDDEARLAWWKNCAGGRVENGELLVTSAGVNLEKTFAPQSWRFQLEWRVNIPVIGQRTAFSIGEVAEVGVNAAGAFYYATAQGEHRGTACAPGTWHTLKVEIDLENGRYNFYADEVLLADFVAVKAVKAVDRLAIAAPAEVRLDDLWGVGYARTFDPATTNVHDRDIPFEIHTFLDENFAVRAGTQGWADVSYDDHAWNAVPCWPYAHGGERFEGEALFLRTNIRVADFQRAELYGEALDPSGEIWVNGRPVEVRRDRHPFVIDVTPYLIANADNLVAIRVAPYKATRRMRHTTTDLNTGWSAGRVWLNLTARRWIKDAFVRTEAIGTEGEAALHISALVRNDQLVVVDENEAKTANGFEGRMSVALYPWYPVESSTPAVTITRPLSIDFGRDQEWTEQLTLPSAALWSPESPQLYKVVIRLEQTDGTPIDDYVLTTGIRTVSQDGGTFRINGQPSMMNGCLLFGYRYPLDKIAQWARTTPEEWIVRDLLMLKKLNANTARMSQHDGPMRSINDPRYAEIGDQLGIMFQWATTAWVRTSSPYQLDFEGLPKYVRQVRNHPSIVMWQPGNHPMFTKGYDHALEWIRKVHETIYAEDPSRLISPSARFPQMRNDAGTRDKTGNATAPNPAWTLPMLVRGEMDHITGYGAEWRQLRLYPRPDTFESDMGGREGGLKEDYLNSPARAYFDFESEESAAQPNWTLFRGKPQYQIRSYEIDYDIGSIGRSLTVDEWRESQAWQAMSGYEAYRKKRWLDYDGLAWCTLAGGGNTGTYEKPLTDYYRFAKIGFQAIKMAFQPVLAGSKNVDVAYGPDDTIPIVILNLGPARRVDVTLRVLNSEGVEVAHRFFGNVTLHAGRTQTELPPVKFDGLDEGYYSFEYVVTTTDAALDLTPTRDLATLENTKLEEMKGRLLAIHADVQRERGLTRTAITEKRSQVEFQ